MITEKIAEIINERGITISKISQATGIPQQILYNSFDKNKSRELKADELILVCRFLDVNPLEFDFDSKSA